MIKDNRGQISLEYLLIFSISLIIITVFSLPLLHESMDNTFDVSDSLKAKADLSNIAQAIKHVYGEGQGSKRVVKLDISLPVKISVAGDHVSSKIKLKNGESKTIKIYVNSKLKRDDFNLGKGRHEMIVEWPIGDEHMKIYQK
ncbi:class III signal peptide-containing protein [uncultured Methanobrevibacter sp.]|uniref:class III signal peptide-containing protein n=1 Tax=uncultured Methanobrevibacter sp. TaxID=253161 RepID=UPI0026129AA4|nr:class III signal peptide-containing protein [uncultured Methanobrevibacter sp.]